MLLCCVGAGAHADDLQKRQCFSPEEAVGHQWRSLDALGCVGAGAHVDDLQKRQCFSPEEAVGHQWRSLDALVLCRSRCTCR